LAGGENMFLKKLKISGFKSFAKSVTINFESPITAIVGPNGSGKSNIVDAIRWVLGEQSAHSLRGSKMADIIFAGSEQQQPMKRAKVTIHLNNQNDIFSVESEEVKVSRIVDQNGTSDYYINGDKCRLKDVKSLLLDSGLGNSSYAIVSQGEITSIINNGPAEIREYFEETAGITKHKIRKNEAEKRLEETNSDLQRIDDLIYELEEQLKPLKKEAKKAEKYLTLKKKLKKIEINLLFDKWKQLKTELAEVEKNNQFLLNKMKNKKEKLEQVKNNYNREKQKFNKKEEKLDRLENECYQLKSKIEAINNNLEVRKERKKGLKREKENKNIDIDKLKDKKRKLKKNKKKIKKKIKEGKNNEGVFKIEFDDPKFISILLPSSDFEYYSSLKEDKNNVNIIHASLVVPALVETVHLMESENSGFDEFQNNEWHKILAKILDQTKGDSPLEKVQNILDLPLNREFLSMIETLTDE